MLLKLSGHFSISPAGTRSPGGDVCSPLVLNLTPFSRAGSKRLIDAGFSFRRTAFQGAGRVIRLNVTSERRGGLKLARPLQPSISPTAAVETASVIKTMITASSLIKLSAISLIAPRAPLYLKLQF